MSATKLTKVVEAPPASVKELDAGHPPVVFESVPSIGVPDTGVLPLALVPQALP